MEQIEHSAEAMEDVVARALKMAQSKGASDAKVSLGVHQGMQVSSRMGEIESLSFHKKKGMSVTVYVGHKKGSSSTNDLSDEALEQTVTHAIDYARQSSEDPYAGVATQGLVTTPVSCDLHHPWGIDIEQAKAHVLSCEAKAMSVDKRIENSDGASLSTSTSLSVLGHTGGMLSSYASSSHGLSCVVIGKDEHGMQRDYEYTVARDPSQLLSVEQVGQKAGEHTLARLGSRAAPTGKVPVIFSAKVAATLMGHFVSAISGAALYRGSSFLVDSLGKPVFASNVNMQENPHLPKGMGSCPFDGDGVQTQPRALVVDGVVQGYVLSHYSSKKLGMKNTANAGGVHNLLVQPTDGDLASMIAQLHKGFVVTELMGQGINLVDGSYSRGAAGFWVEQGQIQYPVHESTIAGNLKDMFAGIRAIGSDVDIRKNIQTGSIWVEQMMVAGS